MKNCPLLQPTVFQTSPPRNVFSPTNQDLKKVAGGQLSEESGNSRWSIPEPRICPSLRRGSWLSSAPKQILYTIIPSAFTCGRTLQMPLPHVTSFLLVIRDCSQDSQLLLGLSSLLLPCWHCLPGEQQTSCTSCSVPHQKAVPNLLCVAPVQVENLLPV